MRTSGLMLLTIILTGCSTWAKAPVGHSFTLSWSGNERAVPVLQEKLRRDSDNPDLSSYSRISYMRELKGDTEGAIQAMQMAIQAGAPDAENTAWCIVQLGNLYLGSSRLSDAEAGFRAALARFPGYVHAYAGLAKVAAAKNNFASAAEYYRKAADRVPMPEFLIGLASVYRKMGKPYEAQAQLDLVSSIKKVYEANGVSMDAEIAQLMEKAGIQQTGS